MDFFLFPGFLFWFWFFPGEVTGVFKNIWKTQRTNAAVANFCSHCWAFLAGFCNRCLKFKAFNNFIKIQAGSAIHILNGRQGLRIDLSVLGFRDSCLRAAESFLCFCSRKFWLSRKKFYLASALPPKRKVSYPLSLFRRGKVSATWQISTVAFLQEKGL